MDDLIAKYKAFIIDLDGVMYLIREPIEGSVEAVRRLQEEDLPFVFLTNNSSATLEQYIERMKNIGLIIDEDRMVTSSQALAKYMKGNLELKGKKVLSIGGEGLKRELVSIGLDVVSPENGESADIVVVGWDGDFSYQKLKSAVIAIRNGADYFATNIDASYPTPSGLWPGAGTMVAAVSTGSGIEPFIAGKPNRLIVELALERLDVDRKEALLVGDRLESDILAGRNAGVDTLLVLTGVSKREEIKTSGMEPTYVRNNLASIFDE